MTELIVAAVVFVTAAILMYAIQIITTKAQIRILKEIQELRKPKENDYE